MVKLSQAPLWQAQQPTDANVWLSQLPTELQQDSILSEAARYVFVIGHDQAGLGGISCWQQGLSMADSLVSLKADTPLLVAALLYPAWHHNELDIAEIHQQFGECIGHLLKGAERMDAVSVLHATFDKNPSQMENCRKMLLAMATDLRVVLLKLVERLHALRTAVHLSDTQRQQLGDEIMTIYAPLANRLGLGQLKWEMEDLAFRAIDPVTYKDIAQQLDMRRIERDQYIVALRQDLEQMMQTTSIAPYQVTGRAKHIYSIHRKISRKSLSVKDLFDISAFRIQVPTIEDCYRVLDLVQQRFHMIEQEFDDYIAQPKSNGYQSIHTAVLGPQDFPIEIQIRTHDMHQLAELGVAAHWRYKEGGSGNQDYETKIAWLRELLSWQDEVSNHHSILADRIYVFTPQNNIVDLPQGATPLDFAYYIHTNIGHRCRGAKINGHIVPLNTPLKMADRVEIITAKALQPRLDWLNSHTGYVSTARARSKILHWFKTQDLDQKMADGKSMVDKELKRFHLTDVSIADLARGFHFPNVEDFYAALGTGTLKTSQLTSRLQTYFQQQAPVKTPATKVVKAPAHGILIEGIGNLLSHPAKCCMPVPGDTIVGYITLRQGVAIHRHDCHVFLEQSHLHPQQVLQVYWGNKTDSYPLNLTIDAHDRPGLTSDITTVISHQKINLLAMQVRVNAATCQAHCDLTLSISAVNSVGQLLDELERVSHVIQVKRKG